MFKRFTQAMEEQVKNDTLVRFPLKGLDLSPYMLNAGSPAVGALSSGPTTPAAHCA